MEPWVPPAFAPAQPQCVSRPKLNLRRRNPRANSNPAVAATITNDTNCCQSILATYSEMRRVQQILVHCIEPLPAYFNLCPSALETSRAPVNDSEDLDFPFGWKIENDIVLESGDDP